MYQDVVELRAFYQSPLGQITQRLIGQEIRRLWPSVRNMDLVGLGYTPPFLEQFRDEASHVISIMPAAQGVMRWPRYRNSDPASYSGNLSTIAHDNHLPLRDASMDRILLVHMLEHTEQSRRLLREVWRTLAPGGRVLLIVPNRMGFWCRSDRTPFGHGHPYSSAQIKQMLSDNMLTPTHSTSALNLPPFKSRSLMSLLPALEATGQRWWHNIAGVLMIEAEKQIYAGSKGKKQPERVRRTAAATNGNMNTSHNTATSSPRD